MTRRARPTRHVTVVTGTRAEYGLLRSTMQAIRRHPALQLQTVVTGMHLIKKFGQDRTYVIVTVVIYAIIAAMSGFLPVMLQGAGMSFSDIGFIIFISAVPILFFDVPLGEFVDAVGKRSAVVASLGLLAVSAFLFSVSLNFYFVIFTMVIFAMGNALALITTSVITADFSVQGDRGLMAGVRKFLMSIGVAIGPILGGTVFSMFGTTITFVMLGAVSVGSALFCTAVKKENI